ncbi:hypothetical protein B0H16DRAFT_1480008 [Mycena metata]|uniref:Uncharacterized protein n=1 Tax=Mycena metata TaxID=1033252 RepID=A0AAD7H4K0_9AGAR|nr:hypothetical protein B0H16DRAFT_1480008 [Mycena metata]
MTFDLKSASIYSGNRRRDECKIESKPFSKGKGSSMSGRRMSREKEKKRSVIELNQDRNRPPTSSPTPLRSPAAPIPPLPYHVAAPSSPECTNALGSWALREAWTNGGSQSNLLPSLLRILVGKDARGLGTREGNTLASRTGCRMPHDGACTKPDLLRWALSVQVRFFKLFWALDVSYFVISAQSSEPDPLNAAVGRIVEMENKRERVENEREQVENSHAKNEAKLQSLSEDKLRVVDKNAQLEQMCQRSQTLVNYIKESAAKQKEELEESLTCPICLTVFHEPDIAISLGFKLSVLWHQLLQEQAKEKALKYSCPLCGEPVYTAPARNHILRNTVTVMVHLKFLRGKPKAWPADDLYPYRRFFYDESKEDAVDESDFISDDSDR